MKFKVSETKGGKNQSHLSKLGDFFVETGLTPNVDSKKLAHSTAYFLSMSVFIGVFVGIPLYALWWGFKLFFGPLLGI